MRQKSRDRSCRIEPFTSPKKFCPFNTEVMHESANTCPARIAINAIPLLGRLTGVGHYIRELVHQFGTLSPQYEYIYYYGYFTQRILTGGKRIHGIKDFLSKMPLVRTSLRGFRGTVAKYHRAEFDLYFEPNFIPLDIRAKSIVTTVHDFSFQLFPEAHPKDRVRYFSKNFLKSVRRSSKIITDSGYTKIEAIDILRVPGDMITPIHLGVDHGLFKIYPREAQNACRRELGLPEKFILFVGTREPRKNVGRLVQAYAELPDPVQREFSLVLVGPRGWGESDPARGKKLANRVMVLDYLDTQKLALAYNLASALAYPSLYEGFGLPAIEAMACGCPVIVSRVASLPEVCADAACYVDPTDVQSIAAGMNRVLSDNELRRSLIKNGIERTKLFTWEKTAVKTLEVFNEVLSTAN
jgi:glycosyltransferase involved in cell wall biosynthesis